MDWQVFQADVLDALKQYEGFFDFFERTGTLSDQSRPDCVARVSRERNTVWIFDAKNKRNIDEEDEQRMEKYVEQIRNNPLDVGLEYSELGEHEIKGVFIAPEASKSKFEVISVESLHQHLRKELIYTETDRVVRDVAQMAEKEVLHHSQARMLYRSLDSFRSSMNRARKMLKQVESSFTDLKLREHPLEDRENLPVDFLLEHGERDRTVLVDVPYRESKVSKLEEIAREEDIYVVLGDTESKYGCRFDKFEEKLMEKLGIMPWRKVAEIFTPKIPTEMSFEASKIRIQDTVNLGFRAEIESVNDTKFNVRIEAPEKVMQRLKEQKVNSRKELGQIDGGSFRHSFSVNEDLEIDYGDKETLESYLDTVDTVFQSGLNPYLSRKVTRS
ncbi:MAG: hypothetical protein V5A72_02300 [Candidatus Nanohaloarchaea archaeon]